MFCERGDKSKKSSAEESGQCNMRTVTTEDNPYKVAGDILLRLRKWNRFQKLLIYMDLLSGEKKKMCYIWFKISS